MQKSGLNDGAEQRVYSLSSGKQQRVAIAKAIIKPSKIILADEPTENFDEENACKIMELLRYINKTLRKTVVVVTHNRDLIQKTDIEINLDRV